MLGFVQKLFDTNDREVKRLQNEVVAQTNALEAQMEQVEDLAAAYAELRRRHQEGGESLDALMPEAFALTRESAKRFLGLRHYDVQLIGGAALHYGRIAEMKTGEGKTLVATLALVLNALTGKGTHLVTTNDYLAATGAEWMGPVYRGLGLEVAVIKHDTDAAARRAAYRSDITYITNSELGFDYLRDNMAFRPDQLVLREDTPLHYAIIDEVDSILIDEARTPLIISGPAEVATDKYYTMAKVAQQLERGEPAEGEKPATGDYSADAKSKDIHLTEQGIAKAEKLIGIDNIFSPENMEVGHMLRQALRAREHYHLDKQYVKDDNGQIVIVDEFTGRLMPGRRFGEGLHQAIEAKEGVKIERENQTLATITYQNFFKLYDKIAGMTGTAKTEEKEFQEIYGADVLVIPTNKPVVRVDHEDVVFRTEEGKYKAVVEEIAEVHAKGQPVLVGTVTIEASELLSKMLKRRGIPHEVLNAKFHQREAEIVAQAGRSGAVTISTNMAGRGTDIVLGGNAEWAARQLLEREGFDRYDSDVELFIKAIMLGKSDEARALARKLEGLPADIIGRLEKLRDEAAADHERVVALGGLHIIGTERHESRRIDNQLRGRAGRQGDPGSSRFYVSFEDDLMRLFANERVLGMMDRLGMDDSQPIEARMVTGAIERAQKRVEDRNFGIRKQLLEYDNVMSKQREVIYAQRREVLLGNDMSEEVQEMIAQYIDAQVQSSLNPELEPEEREVGALKTALVEAVPAFEALDFEAFRSKEPDDVTDELVAAMEAAYQQREEELGAPLMRELERFIVLQVVDQNWKEHLHNMDVLRQGIGLRGYGQRNPLQEYAFEGFNLFEEMNANIRLNVAKLLFRVQVQTDQRLERRAQRPAAVTYSGAAEGGVAAAATASGAVAGGRAPQRGTGPTSPIRTEDKVGRNDPCPCGSGKKYKHCHGRTGLQA
ncbi:MAG: preprotein translocase subunit SecA [Deinococcales bacterium]|nr:preprotein translocase subunit SecA [Deinococcales bacterium]